MSSITSNSESMSDPNDDSTSTNNRFPLSSAFLEFCAKVRNNHPSILPEPGGPFKFRPLSKKENIEIADALLESTSVTFLELGTDNYKKSSAEAMAKYVRTSKHLQRIRWPRNWVQPDNRVLKQREDMFCRLLPAIQESTSLKELHILNPITGGRPTWRSKIC
jgi:hypothetical protein